MGGSLSNVTDSVYKCVYSTNDPIFGEHGHSDIGHGALVKGFNLMCGVSLSLSALRTYFDFLYW